MKNRLIEIYKNKLSEEFWAHDNIDDSLFLKYIFIMLKIHIFEITQYYRKTKVKYAHNFNNSYSKKGWIRNWTQKLPEKITTSNEVLRILVEIANERFYKVLKMMELSNYFDVIYKNTIEYYRYYEDKILKLGEPIKESKYSKFVGMNLKNWKSMEG